MRRRIHGVDSGMTLVELLVAMSIFSVLLTIFGAGIVSMTNITARVQATADTTTEGRNAFNRLDKQVRSASAINRAVQVGNDVYIEFLTDATGASAAGVENPSRCTQWRLVGDDDRLEIRSWLVGASPTVWNVAASYVTNDPLTEPPFVFAPSTSDLQKQRLHLDLRLQRGAAPETVVQSTFVARNSTVNSATNFGTDRVCTDVGQP